MVNQLKKTVKEHPRATVSLSVLVVLCIACAVGGWVLRDQSETVKRFGYKPNWNATALFNARLGGSLRTNEPQLFRGDLPEHAPLWRARDQVYKEKTGRDYVRGAQGIGDCVSWGSADALDVSLAVAYLEGKAGDWKETATESIYGLRGELGESLGYYSDGWWGSGAARGLSRLGVLHRQIYEDGANRVDLTRYDANRARDWGHYGTGGRGSTWLDKFASNHKVPHVALVRTTEEAKASLANGYAIFVCSGIGFDPCVRNEHGVVRRGGSWSHCMACVGYYTVNGQVIFVIENSWGPNSVRGPAGPFELSGAMFGISTRDMQSILDQQDSYAVSGPNGFEPQELDFSGWGTAEVKRKREQYVTEQEMRLSL